MEKKCKIIYLNNFIYILSDDEIKEGDWCYNSISNCIFKFIRNTNTSEDFNTISETNRLKGVMLDGYSTVFDIKTSKKIIATTDTSLKESIDMVGTGSTYIFNFPQPSQQFIEKYIKSYNKGEIITDVLVEYSPSSITIQTYSGQQVNDNLKALTLKVNPKDNTITIKKL